MDPLTLVAAAVALGASEALQETTKNFIVDSYTALKGYITRRYTGATREVEGIESEPGEELWRQLLAKKLTKEGAGDDTELQDLAQEVLRQIQEHAPNAEATVGVRLSRVSAGGDITVADIDVEGGSGVTADDVATDGSLTISGVKVRNTQEPPHPSQARQ